MRCDAVYKYADTYDENYSTYDLPEESHLHQVTLKPGLVSCPQALVRQLADDDLFREVYQKSMLIYDQLCLISSQFEGEMIGPACLYITAKPGKEDSARMCLESIDNSFLVRLSCVLRRDCLTIKQAQQYQSRHIHDQWPFR